MDAAYQWRLRSVLRDLHLRLLREGRVGAAVLGETGGAIPAGGPLHPHARLGSRGVLLAGDAAGLANPVTVELRKAWSNTCGYKASVRPLMRA